MFYNSIFSVLHAKALYYQETLCRKEDIQKFLSSLVRKCRDLKRYFIFFFLKVSKKPEVGHLVKCFHLSKSADSKTNSGKYSAEILLNTQNQTFRFKNFLPEKSQKKSVFRLNFFIRFAILINCLQTRGQA